MGFPSLRVLRSAAPLLLLVAGACGDGATSGGFDTTAGVGIGGACDDRNLCRNGLSCVASVCEAAGTTKDGDPCTIGAECASGVCGPSILTGTGAKPATCSGAGAGAEGDSCGGDADCGKGLRCGFDGTGMFPKCVKEGAGDVGAECASSLACRQGLVCTAGRCATPLIPEASAGKGVPPYVPGPDAWQGAKCDEPKKGDVTAQFQVPRPGDAPHEDFYRLPFPNDAARDKSTGKVSFASHPHDPKPAMGFDAVKLYLDALEAEPFGNYATTYFRFDGEFDFDTVRVAEPELQTRIVDLTAGPTFGERQAIGVFVTNGRNRYICPNYVAVRPALANPYKAGHTYGVIMKKGVQSCPNRDGGKCSGGTPAKQHPDFAAMLGGSKPSDAALGDAWDAYQPLRDWMTKEKLAADDLLVATVFTVGDPARVATKLETSVKAATAPAAEGWVKCDTGVASPCAQADEKEGRACGAASADFDEWHALIDVPVFQQGQAPYLKDGGAMATSGSGPITPVRTEKVCMAVTVPKGTPPAGGWPVALYAHGTGGSFRSHVTDGTAKALSSVDLGSGTSVRFAVVGIDQAQHGPRRGDSKLHPNDLFFNFANPQAARYNALQGAADQHALARFFGASPTIPDGASGVKLDGSKLVYWGHSQGATHGALFLARDTTVKGAVLSGEGGSLMDALLTKTKPVNIKDALWLALSEAGPSSVDVWHPVLSLLQSWIDPSDPMELAAATVRVPGATAGSSTIRSVFQPFGKDDTYTPWEVQATFALAAGLAYVGPEVDPKDLLKGRSVASIEGNVTEGAAKATAAFRQYAPPSGRDGHFVAFDVDQARTDAAKFLARVARGEVPKLPE